MRIESRACPAELPDLGDLPPLLTRLYDPTAGHIKIDGIDLRDMDPAQLRGNIGVVSQDISLFAGTILENIAYGRPESSQEEIVAAAEAAGVADD